MWGVSQNTRMPNSLGKVVTLCWTIWFQRFEFEVIAGGYQVVAVPEGRCQIIFDINKAGNKNKQPRSQPTKHLPSGKTPDH